jgi:hypothetical protein
VHSVLTHPKKLKQEIWKKVALTVHKLQQGSCFNSRAKHRKKERNKGRKEERNKKNEERKEEGKKRRNEERKDKKKLKKRWEGERKTKRTGQVCKQQRSAKKDR